MQVARAGEGDVFVVLLLLRLPIGLVVYVRSPLFEARCERHDALLTTEVVGAEAVGDKYVSITRRKEGAALSGPAYDP